MKVHKLWTDPEVFGISLSGIKPWEIRKNDRGFQPGDLIILQETVYSGDEMKCGLPLEYTGRELSRIIVYILPQGSYGLDKDWVVMTVDMI